MQISSHPTLILTTAQWTAANPILALGQVGVDDLGRVKIGDGTTPWSSLSYTTTSLQSYIQTITSSQSITVPPWATVARVYAVGAGGGGGGAGSSTSNQVGGGGGGGGAEVSIVVPVTGGETLSALIGSIGIGGSGGNSGTAGGVGGSTSLQRNAPIVYAAGGSGGAPSAENSSALVGGGSYGGSLSGNPIQTTPRIPGAGGVATSAYGYEAIPLGAITGGGAGGSATTVAGSGGQVAPYAGAPTQGATTAPSGSTGLSGASATIPGHGGGGGGGGITSGGNGGNGAPGIMIIEWRSM